MNPPMINSTSSVSTSKRKREAERSVNWTVEETQVLLCAWSDERIQKSLAENLRNRHVFKHLSARMSEMGFSRSPHQCRLRVKTLKANYVRTKLQKSVDSSQPCTFKYFAEMDAVLGRRGEAGEGALHLGSMEEIGGRNLGSVERTGGHVRPSLSSEIDVVVPHYASIERAAGRHFGSTEERRGRQAWPLVPEVKMEEDIEYSTDGFEFMDARLPRPLRDQRHDVFLESNSHHEPLGGPMEDSLITPSPPPPPPQPADSPLPRPPDPNVGLRDPPTPTQPQPQPNGSLEPALRHLSECFQRLVSETRGLLVQMEGARQEQARWHQELLTRWLEREERRHREAADREERRERARMEHEIRVLELLTGLAQQRSGPRERQCRCEGSQAAEEPATGLNHKTESGNRADAL